MSLLKAVGFKSNMNMNTRRSNTLSRAAIISARRAGLRGLFAVLHAEQSTLRAVYGDANRHAQSWPYLSLNYQQKDGFHGQSTRTMKLGPCQILTIGAARKTDARRRVAKRTGSRGRVPMNRNARCRTLYSAYTDSKQWIKEVQSTGLFLYSLLSGTPNCLGHLAFTLCELFKIGRLEIVWCDFEEPRRFYFHHLSAKKVVSIVSAGVENTMTYRRYDLDVITSS